jgi:ankyrin repeat protein
MNVKNEFVNPIFLIATDNGHIEIVKLLIQAGVDVNTKDRYGNSALMIAVYKSNLELVNLLIKEGADPLEIFMDSLNDNDVETVMSYVSEPVTLYDDISEETVVLSVLEFIDFQAIPDVYKFYLKK